MPKNVFTLLASDFAVLILNLAQYALLKVPKHLMETWNYAINYNIHYFFYWKIINPK